MRTRRIKKGPVAASLLILIILLVGSLFLFKNIFTVNPDDNPIELNKNQSKKKSLTIAMVGDVLIHGSVYQDAILEPNKYDFRYIFKDVEPLLKDFDLKFYNQESIIGGKSLGLSTYPKFNSPEEIGDAMVDLGFNIVALANNHTLDKGEKGINNSIKYWESKETMFSGSALNEEGRIKDDIREKNSIKYTLLSYTTSTNGIPVPSGKDYLVNVYNKEKVKADVERIKNNADIIIVSMHWGNEYTNVPSSEQKEIANYLSSLGVHIIVGHHPHVIQPVELIGNTICFYSLGNFISAQDNDDKLTGVVASLKVNILETNDKKTITFNNIKTDLVYTYHKSYSNYKIIPYKELTTSQLSNYKSMYDKYSTILTSLNSNVEVTKIGDE